jgi:hypothetical protein
VGLPVARNPWGLPRSQRFSLCMPGPEDPDRPSSLSPSRCLCVGFRCVQTVAVCLLAFTRLSQTSGCAVTLPAYRVPCVRSTWFVQGSRSSSPSATLGTGSWLDLTRWGLPPHKKRQASLSALTARASSLSPSHCRNILSRSYACWKCGWSTTNVLDATRGMWSSASQKQTWSKTGCSQESTRGQHRQC